MTSNITNGSKVMKRVRSSGGGEGLNITCDMASLLTQMKDFTRH